MKVGIPRSFGKAALRTPLAAGQFPRLSRVSWAEPDLATTSVAVALSGVVAAASLIMLGAAAARWVASQIATFDTVDQSEGMGRLEPPMGQAYLELSDAPAPEAAAVPEYEYAPRTTGSPVRKELVPAGA